MPGYQQRPTDRSTTALEPTEGSTALAPEPQAGQADNSFLLEQMALAPPLSTPLLDASAGAPMDGVAPGWAASDGMDAGAAGDLFGFGEGEAGGPDSGGMVPDSVVAWVDTVLPKGLGVALSAELGGTLGVGLSAGAAITVNNDGEGWLEVEGSGSVTPSAPIGAGGEAADSGAEVEAGLEGAVEGTRTFKVPWTRLCDPVALAQLGGSAVLGEVLGVPIETVVGTLIGGRDLTPFLLGERLEGSGDLFASATLGAMGEDVEAIVKGTLGIAVEMEYEDVADESGERTGTLKVEGNAEALAQIAANLSKTFGVDTTCAAQLAGSGAFVVPFVETGGDKDWGMPYYEASVDAGLGPVGAGATIGIGPEHAAIELHAAIDPGSALWQKVLDDCGGIALEALTLGVAELETSGSMTLGFSVTLDHELIPEAASLAGDVVEWIRTGNASELLTDHLDVVQKLVDSAELTLAVDLTIAALRVSGDLEAAEGFEEGLSGEAEAGVVYQRDDILEDMGAPPSRDELMALLRDPSAALPAAASA